MEYLGLNIKKIRERWKMSQEEFGFLIGATRGMIMQYENRGTKPKNETVSQLVKLTGMTLDMLANSPLGDDEIPEMDQVTWMTIENYRSDPDTFEADPTPEEIKEMMKVQRRKGQATAAGQGNRLGDGDSDIAGETELLQFLKSNDAFFKNQYATFNVQVLTNLTALQTFAKNLEALLKINLEHTGNIEAHQLGLQPAEVHERINRDILAAAGVQMDMPAHSPGKG